MNARILLALIYVMMTCIIVNGEMVNNTSPVYTNDSISHNKTQNLYKIYVDGYYGFYRVYDMNTGKRLIDKEYEDKILNIRINDTVIWENEDPVESFTVTSAPKLWADTTGYLTPAKRFSHTFSQAGTYDIYIRQRQTLPHQTIIVSSLDSNKTIVDTANINKIVTYNEKSNEYTNDIKSKVTIRIYKKPKNMPELETIMIMPIIAIMSILILKRRKRR